MSPSRRNWTWRNCSRCSSQRQRWRIWWTWSCSWGKYAIILSSLNVDQPAHLFPSNSCTTTQDPFLLEQERSNCSLPMPKTPLQCIFLASSTTKCSDSLKRNLSLLSAYWTSSLLATSSTILPFLLYQWPTSPLKKSNSASRRINYSLGCCYCIGGNAAISLLPFPQGKNFTLAHL